MDHIWPFLPQCKQEMREVAGYGVCLVKIHRFQTSLEVVVVNSGCLITFGVHDKLQHGEKLLELIVGVAHTQNAFWISL